MLDRPHYQPTPDDAWADEKIQSALKVLSDYHAREWEASRPEREAELRKQIVAWQEHEAGSLRRADAYEAEAAACLRRAAEQRENAAFAKRWIETLEDSL